MYVFKIQQSPVTILIVFILMFYKLKPLNANLTESSNTLKLLSCWWIVWVCWTILCGWLLKEIFKMQIVENLESHTIYKSELFDTLTIRVYKAKK